MRTEPPPPPNRRSVLEHDIEFLRGLLTRLKISWLLQHFPERLVWAAFLFINGFVAISLLAVLAMLTRTAFVFPSLGPTAFMFFFNPTRPSASPKNTICGHAIGILCGYGALWLLGLQDQEPTLIEGVGIDRVICAALSLAATGALMVLLDLPHPPASATTLIVSLGIVRQPVALVIMEAAVALMTLQAIAVNRLAGIDYPWWSKRR
jgi:CBS domain-containing membrane protein